MLKTLLRDEQNNFQVVQDVEAISELVSNKDRLLWLDLERPSLAEFRMIQDEFNLHPLAIEDAMARHPRPKVDQYDNFYLVVFYLVSANAQKQADSPSTNGAPSTADTLGAGNDGRAQFRKLVQAAATGYQEAGGGGYGQQVQMGQAAGLGANLAQLGASQAPQAGVPNADDRISLREMTMFMGENYLITVHNSPVPELAEVARRWQHNAHTIRPGKKAGAETANLPGCRPLTDEERAGLEAHPVPSHDKPPGERQSAVVPGEVKDGNGRVGPSSGVAEAEPGRPVGVYRRPKNGRHNGRSRESGILLYSLLDTIVDHYFPVVDSIVDRVEDLEEEIFERYSVGAIESIFGLKKDLLALRKVLAPERDVLNILVRRDLPIFDQQTLLYFQDLYDHVVRITDSIDTYRDLLSSALDSYLSMQSNRLNITVQTLTSVSIILMSIATITGWYGMNFQHMPELASPLGYPAVIGVVLLVTAVEVALFKRKGWL